MKLPLHILTPLLLSASMLGACSSDNGGLHDPSRGDGKVDLVLDLGINPGTPSASRALTPEEGVWDFEPATINYEKVNTFRVIILRPSHNYEVEVNRLITGTTINTEDGEAFFPDYNAPVDQANVGRFVFEVADLEWKKIYLIANEEALPQEIQTKLLQITTGKQLPFNLEESLITVQKQTDGQGGYYIDNPEFDPANPASRCFVPLTESFDLYAEGKVVESTDNYTKKTQEANFFITRAATKFSFSAAADVAPGSTFAITGITIGGLYTAEYLFPHNTVYSPGKYETLPSLTAGRLITNFSSPASGTEYTYTFTPTDPFRIEGGTEGAKASTAYVSGNPVFDPNLYFLESPVGRYPITVTTTLDDSDPVTWTSSLPNLSSLPRNTHVRIHLNFTGRTLNATVTVYPYTAVNLNPEFGFTPPVTDHLTVAPEMVLDMADPEHEIGLLYATFTSTDPDSKIDNLIWVSSDTGVVLLGDNEDAHITPSESIELPWEKPVQLIPQKAGTTYVTAYSNTGLVARCKVIVK